MGIAKRVKLFGFTLCLGLAVMLCLGVAPLAYAAQPAAVNNLAVSLRSNSELVPTSSGYMRVYFDGNKTIGIEDYDNDFNLKGQRSLAMELPHWGGFYAGNDGYYYLVEGRSNTAESDSAEVIRVIKYDKNWNRKGAASITGSTSLFGGQVRYPFDYGCVEMVDYQGKLYIVTGHEGYVDDAVGQGHQGFLMIAVDTATMKGNVVKSDLWHSFAQYIALKGSRLYVLEQSEGSRYTKLSQYEASDLKGTSISVLNYGGSRDSAWAVSCFASVDGLAVSSANVLGVGTSIDQSKYDQARSESLPHNIYLTVTSQSSFSPDSTQIKWITNYSDKGKAFLGVKITKINDNRFLVSWEEFDATQKAAIDDPLSESILHYVFVDGSGNKLTKEYTAAAPISDCQPVVKNNKVVYYAANSNTVNFYSIDASTGSFGKKTYRVAGPSAAWSLSNGVLTVSGSGAISAAQDTVHRAPRSSTSGVLVFYERNDWEAIQGNVKKLIVKAGITEIGESAFHGFDNLETVVVESGVRKIGSQAFAHCSSLRKLYLPSSVNSIGEDLTWTGSYWVGSGEHVMRGTIYAPSGSYAAKYAQNNGIGFSESSYAEGSSQGKTPSTRAVSVSAKDITKTYSKKTQRFALGAKASQGVKLTYKSNNKSVTVDSQGKVTVKAKFVGKATITIMARDSKGNAATKKVTVTVSPTKTKLTSVKNAKGKKAVVKWKRNKIGNGYVVRYSTDKKFKKNVKTKKVRGNAKTTLTLSKLKKGKTYYVQIQTYKNVAKKSYTSSWSAVKKVKIKK